MAATPDARLRELERAWRETGALADEARYLVERARTGELQTEALALAAHAGHAAAREALAKAAPARGERDLRLFVMALRRWDPEASLVTASAATRTLIRWRLKADRAEVAEDYAFALNVCDALDRSVRAGPDAILRAIRGARGKRTFVKLAALAAFCAHEAVLDGALTSGRYRGKSLAANIAETLGHAVEPRQRGHLRLAIERALVAHALSPASFVRGDG